MGIFEPLRGTSSDQSYDGEVVPKLIVRLSILTSTQLDVRGSRLRRRPVVEACKRQDASDECLFSQMVPTRSIGAIVDRDGEV